MSLHIIDTFSDIEKCFDDTGFVKSKWDKYISRYLQYAKATIEDDASGYNFEKDILPILNEVKQNSLTVMGIHNVFVNLCDGLEEHIRLKLNTDIDTVIVLYLGLCNGAGWAVNFSGIPHVLLGIEKIIELNWCSEPEIQGLLYHELGHIWHNQHIKSQQQIIAMKDKALWQLYREGVAMYCEQLLCEDNRFYHQDKNGWLNWCEENKATLFKEYIRVIENNESHQKFFGDWCSYLGVSDTGYYLGCELIKKALETRPISDILNFSLRDIESTLYGCINSDFQSALL